MMDSLLKRIEKNRKAHTRWLAMVLCLSMLVSLGTFAGLHKSAQAKVYTKEVLDCPYAYEGAEPVAHVHNDDCFEGETLVCTLPELEAHTHTEECFAEQRRLTCGLEENPGHQHGEGCYVAREVNVCGLEENPGHEHNGTCYNESGVLICGMEAGEGAHVHTDACFTTVYDLVCQIPEGEGAHTHTDDCYTTERYLICDKPELPVHVHDAGCFRTEEITVDEPEETAEPVQTENPEKTVPEMPVSDPAADLETASDWERDFDDLELSGNWAQDLVLVAATQQGHGESLNNFEAVLNDAGDAWVLNGYTRYGAWYGVPYAEEWSAMFVSFCLRYAGIPTENVPNNPTAALMAESFSKGELFASRGYVPAVGDLIFFDTVHDDVTNIDHMGIVYHVDAENGTINTVEGDRTNAVATFGYHLDDEEIVGYGILPQNPDYIPAEEENNDDETDGLIVMTEEKQETEETTDTEATPVPAIPMPAQSWERTAGGIKVTVEAPEGAFPENTKIAVTPVNGNSLKDTVSDAVNGEVLEVQAVDITFFDVSGHEIEPAVPIRVVMTPAVTQHAEEKTSVVHVDIAQQTAEIIEQAVGTEFDNSEVVFDADAFTIYAIVYTYQVEYEYEVDGKTFTSSMPGAENMTLTQIVEGLGIVDEAEIDTFVSKIESIASTNEEVATVAADGSVRVLKDGEAQIVITMQDGAKFKIDVKAEGETSASNKTATVSTKGDLYLPAEAELKAEVLDEVKSESAIAAVEAQEGTPDSNAATAETAYQVFDISLENVSADQYDGFQVEVKLPENVIGRDFRLYHIHNGETTEINLNTVSRPADDTGLEVVSGFTFETQDFSEFVLSYTVDFTYEGRTLRFPGQGSYRLADILASLGIEGAIDDAVLTLVEGMDHAGALYLSQMNGEYYISSDIAFLDTYELRVQIGERIYIITVTDAMDTESPWNLANRDNTQFLHVSAESTVTESEQERDAAFKLTFTYSLEEDVVRAIDALNGEFSLVYDLNSLINDSPIGNIRNNTNGVISIGSRKLGTYTVIDGVVTLHFTDPSYFDGRTSFTGFFNLTVDTSETKLGTKDEWKYEFPGTSDTVTIHYKKTVEEGSKTVSKEKNPDGSYTLHYTANVNVNSDLNSMTFYDTLGGLQTLDVSSVKINGTPVSVSTTSNGFTFDVANALGTTGVSKGSYQVTYDTTVTEAQLKEMSADKTTETNNASWTVNGNKDVPGGKTSIEIDKPREPIPVTKTISSTANQPGDTVSYTVTYGKDTTALSGFHISDYMTDVVIPQGDVTLTYNGQTTHVNFDSQSKDSSYSKGTVTLFDYTFPEGTAGNGPVTATYTVKLIDSDTAKANGIYDATDVSNVAQEHRQNTTDNKKTTVTYEKEPTYEVDKTVSPSPEKGKWAPGTVLSYTLTIGDAQTNMAGVHIKDVMTDLQILQGDIMIRVGNGQQMKLSDYVADAIKWTDDRQYSTNDVDLFSFNMPSNAGNGPVVITYETKVIEQTAATSSGIYGDKTIKNTGSGGKQSDGTEGIGEFEPFPVTKTVTQNDANVNGQTVEMGSMVHYTLTYGKEGMNLAGAVIEDWMTDLQKLVSGITITKKDGSSFEMPMGTGLWSDAGNNWSFLDDGKYSTDRIMLFKYHLPQDIDEGPITIEYDTQIISEDEAKEFGITGTQSAFNKFIEPQTEVKIEFPKAVTHNPQVRKEFNNDWNLETNTLYWDIIVEKDADSAYPLENVTVREFYDWNGIFIKNSGAGYHYYSIGANDIGNFDLINATLTTDDGTVLTPGIDYSIDKNKCAFTFETLTERVHIHLPFHSPIQISNGFYMHNVVDVNDKNKAEAEAKYTNSNVEIFKNGVHTDESQYIVWEVVLNPSALEHIDSDPIKVMFTDYIPEGLKLVNYTTKNEDEPTIHVEYTNNNDGENLYWGSWDQPVSVNSSNQIVEVDIAAHSAPGQDWDKVYGLNKQKIKVSYITLIPDEEWNRITSSASGSETFENHVTITAGDNETFDAQDTVTVTVDEYINKYDDTVENGGIVFDPASNQSSKNITYSVDINPNGYVLNSNNTLTLTDYISTNMDLDTSSVKVYNGTIGGDGKLVAGEEYTGLTISYNDDSRLLTIRNIPDATPLKLTYTCVARAQGTDTFKNTATLIGGGSHSSTITDEHTIQTNDAGVGVDGIMISLRKIDENNIRVNLKGAKFQLYECKLQIGELTNPDTYNQQWWEKLLTMVNNRTAGNATAEEITNIDEQFKIIEYKPIGGPVETGSTGYTQWESLSERKLYAWREIEAPEGYTGYAPTDYHYFVGYQHMDVNTESPSESKPLSEEEQTARKHVAWALDDATQFANGITVASLANYTTWTATNVESTYTSISASKTWENDSDNLFETRPVGGIKLQLVRINADGSRDNIDSPVVINADSEGEWPTYIWNRLPAKDNDGNILKYTVVEDRVENYTTSYSDNGEGKTSGEIVVTNRMIPKSTTIHVKKVFAEGTEKPSEIKVTLYVIKTDKAGNAGQPEETSNVALLSDSNNWHYCWDKLPTTQVIDGKAYYLSYNVIEDTAALEREGFRYTVSYSDNGEGVIETTEDEPLLITNAKETGKIIVKKTFAGVTDETDLAALQAGLTVTVSGKDVGGEGVDTLTLKWDDVKENGYEITGLPLNETYTVTESLVADDVLPKYTVTSETVSSKTVTATKEGETAELKNIYEVPQTGSLKIQKTGQVNGADPTEDNKAKIDGEYSFTIAGKPDTATKDNSVTVKITLSKGVATAATKEGTSVPADVTVSVTGGVVTISNLPLGTYTVTENLTEVQEAAGIRLTSEDPGDLTVTADSTTIPTATFVNNYETTSATVSKTWAGNGTPPRTLEVALVADGEVTTQEVTLSGTNSWAGTITGLPKYKNGTEIVYTWLEKDLPDGYFLTGSTVNGTITSLTNTYQTYDLKTSYVGIKYWEDENNKYSTRPSDLTVTLTALYWNETTGDYGDPVPLDNTPTWNKDKANQWTYTFSDLPVFDGNGNVIKYSAQETEPAGYKLTSTTSKPTEWQLGSITYSNGTDRTTPDNKVVWTLGSLIDLSFVAIKPTSNGDVVVWTHRTPVPSEVTAITNKIKGGALPGCSNRNIVFYSGTGDVYTPHGNVHVTYDGNLSVTLDFGSTDVWSQFIVGQFNEDNSSSYNVGTTEFTNTLDTTELEGQKTWAISESIVPEGNPILTLTRSVTVTKTEGEGESAQTTTTTTTETVTVKENVTGTDGPTEQTVNLQPEWTGTGLTKTFKYSGLPKCDKDGNPYTYSVAEASFNVKINGEIVTYTVTAGENGTYTVTSDPTDAPKFEVVQADKTVTEDGESKKITEIVNTELTDFEFSKIWNDAGNLETEWPSGKTIKVKVERMIGQGPVTQVVGSYEITKNDTGFVITPADGVPALTVVTSDTTSTTYTFKLSDLPKFGTIGSQTGEYMYFVTETEAVLGYKNASYENSAAGTPGQVITTLPYAQNGGKIINTPEEGYELPQTGGIGTTIFTALGGLMTATAGAILTLKSYRRRKQNA